MPFDGFGGQFDRMDGNGPIPTRPWYATDELIAVRARGDYVTLSSSLEQLAYGTDGVFAPNEPWQLTSASVDFMGQGVGAQHVVFLSMPKSQFPGGGRLMAVDSSQPNAITLRVLGKPLNFGQPPAPLAGLTGVTFTINTFATLIEDASWDLKSRFGIDEMQAYRASSWIYQGAERPFRDLNAACVLQVLIKAFGAETRTDKGDFARKLAAAKAEYDEVLDRLQVRFGPWGDSEQPVTRFSCKISR
jgi:hypothetical protein